MTVNESQSLLVFLKVVYILQFIFVVMFTSKIAHIMFFVYIGVVLLIMIVKYFGSTHVVLISARINNKMK